MGRPPRVQRVTLLDVARRVFAEKGFEATTLADIADELGVTAAALLRHADSKQVLFAEAMRSGVDLPPCVMALATVDATGDQRPVLRRFAREFIPFVQEIISVSLVLNMRRASQGSLVFADAPEVRARRRRGVRVVEDYFRRAIAAGTIRARDARAAARLLVGSLQGYVVAQHVIGIPPYPIKSYVDALMDLWTYGAIVTAKGGNSARSKAKTPEDRGSGSRRAAADRGRGLVRTEPETARARAVRHAGNADRRRGLARRRPRGPRVHR